MSRDGESREGVRVEKECEKRVSVSREGVRERVSASREVVRVVKECEKRVSASREGVRVEKECE